MNQTSRGLIASLMAVVGLTMMSPSLTWAHAFPAAEHPGAGTSLDASPAAVVIDFDSPIESLFAKLEVVDGSGYEENAGPPKVGHNHRELRVALKPLAPGQYTVTWGVVAEDGHRTEGSYTFTVAAGAQ